MARKRYSDEYILMLLRYVGAFGQRTTKANTLPATITINALAVQIFALILGLIIRI